MLRARGKQVAQEGVLEVERKDFNVISAVNDRNDYAGPGTGYQITAEKWEELSNIGNAVDASKIK